MTQSERSDLTSSQLDDARLAEPPHEALLGAAPPVVAADGARLRRLAIVPGAALLVLLIVAVLPRLSVRRELLADAASRDSAPSVEVATVQRATPGSVVTLPGTVQPLHESAIYARVSGYVRRWHADIGTLVRQGAVLVDIDAPELEQNVQQARSQVAMAHAALDLARADLARWTSLARDSAVTGQELDQKRAAFASAQANAGAAEANLRRLVQTGDYTRVVAPFTGVITARNVDIGALITGAGATSAPLANGGSNTPGTGSLFRIAQTDTVRTYVSVPAMYATSVRPGLDADVQVQGIAGRNFAGRLARTSASLDAATRTLLAEIDIPNRDFAILPGMYAQVTLHFPRATPPLLIPAGALVIRSGGPQVMVVSKTGSTATVHLQTVTVGRDYGSTIEITDGLVDGSTIVTTPNADLDEGTKVRVAAAH